MNPNLIDQLKRHEGFRGRPYDDLTGMTIKWAMWILGKATIGYGHNLDAAPICEAAAEVQLIHDVTITEAALIGAAPWYLDLDAVRKAAILNMAFNMGVNNLMQFRNMIAALIGGDYDRAATEALDSKWSSQVGRRAWELAEQIRTGEYQT